MTDDIKYLYSVNNKVYIVFDDYFAIYDPATNDYLKNIYSPRAIEHLILE
jgi:hypothetical protein